MKDKVNLSQEMTDLPDRTKRFASQVILMALSLPKTELAGVFRSQILRSATSVAAQKREARRPKSPKDSISKIEGAIQELGFGWSSSSITNSWRRTSSKHCFKKPANSTPS